LAERALMKGNEAIAEAAIRGGCRFFFGYPITPQNEIPEYMAGRMPEVGGTFIQAESEVAAINMVYGAASAGARVMTSSSSPGISLKQEGISYIAAAELPCVIVNMQRGGPGLGGVAAAQADYFQATKGGGHGDYRLIVLGPGNVQEAVELMQGAFDLAEKWRNPVLMLGDGILGQMMEPVSFPQYDGPAPIVKDWVTDGANGRKPRVINTLRLDPEDLYHHNLHLQAKYAEIAATEVKYEEYMTGDADYVLLAYGTTSRICRAAVELARESGMKLGLFRPITLWPFPEKAIHELADRVKGMMAVEMSMGQMVYDVRLAVNGKKPVYFLGTAGGVVPTPKEIVQKLNDSVAKGGAI
jgi:2-oxoglutarate/2-oxoacid ferredoxin oxidoreductase subunit alpha